MLDLKLDFLGQAIHLLFPYAGKILLLAAILFGGLKGDKFILRAFKRLLDKRDLDPSFRSFLTSTLDIALKLIVVLVAIAVVGVEFTSVAAILGASLLAVGSAMSGTLQNFAAGIIILIIRPFKLGDFIGIKDYEGYVIQILIFTTVIRTLNNRTIHITNSMVVANTITNFTQAGSRRIETTYYIAAGSDVALARKVLLDVIADDARVLTDPPTRLIVTSLESGIVHVMAWVWVAPSDFFNVMFDLNEAVYNEFTKVGLSLAFPQMGLHMAQSTPLIK